MKAIEWFEKIPVPLKFLVGVILIAMIGFLDFATGWELAFSLFYVIPISFVTWFMGGVPGVFSSFACGLTWLWADLALGHPYSETYLIIWNTIIRLSFFILISVLLIALRNAYNKIRRISVIDGLTGAVNSRRFHELLSAELERARRYRRAFSLAYVDLDNFKSVNDRFGHAEGDATLKGIAAVMASQVRTVDVVGRLGGDEFALLFPETDQTSVRGIMRKMHDALSSAMRETGSPVTFSIGVVTCETDFPAPDDLIKAADALMYAVKETGKSAVRYDNYRF